MSEIFQINQSLLRLVSIGDEQAFRVLFDYYKDRFYYVALKMTNLEDIAEETVQEVFIQLWRQRSGLAEVENPDAYFFTVLYRQVYQYYRKAALDKKLILALEDSPRAKNSTDEFILAKEKEQFIREAVGRLPAQQLQVFKLSKEEGLSREEIADKMQISPNTVRNHLAQAMRSVRTYLNDLALFAGIAGSFLSDF
ncbi:MAG: RNA polymerase sigma-70 factor [Ginsengibacter sp.]